MTCLKKLKLYADDALLYREMHSPEDSKILQEDINTLQKWAECWMMQNANILKSN